MVGNRRWEKNTQKYVFSNFSTRLKYSISAVVNKHNSVNM